jgi:hypothetical protein
MKTQTRRQIASRLAQEIMAKMISYEQFVELYPTDTGDDEIDSLFDLIEHQPKLGGYLGVRQNTYDDYNSDIFRLIRKLES